MTEISRITEETSIHVSLDIHGKGENKIQTGIGFFDHMLTLLAFWAGWDLKLTCEGDLHVDTHHTVEDSGLILGKAFRKAWTGDTAIKRIAYAFCPLDEALSRVVVDVCNRPYCTFDANFNVERVGEFETALTDHFFRSFAQEARITVHIHSLYGENDHHVIETMFKGLGLALRRALMPRTGSVASTKGAL